MKIRNEYVSMLAIEALADVFIYKRWVNGFFRNVLNGLAHTEWLNFIGV